MKKIVLACGLLGILGVLGINCGGNACEAYADAFFAKYEGCGVELNVASGSGEVACSDEAAKLYDCYSGCLDKLDCACIDSSKAADCTTEKATAYTDCYAACGK